MAPSLGPRGLNTAMGFYRERQPPRLLLRRSLRALLFGGLAGHFIGLGLLALFGSQNLHHLFVRGLMNFVHLGALLVGGKSGVILDRVHLRFHVFVNFLDLRFLVVGETQTGELAFVFFAVLRGGLLAVVGWRRLLGGYNRWNAAQREQSRGERQVLKCFKISHQNSPQ